jgi:hypothetical protein
MAFPIRRENTTKPAQFHSTSAANRASMRICVRPVVVLRTAMLMLVSRLSSQPHRRSVRGTSRVELPMADCGARVVAPLPQPWSYTMPSLTRSEAALLTAAATLEGVQPLGPICVRPVVVLRTAMLMLVSRLSSQPHRRSVRASNRDSHSWDQIAASFSQTRQRGACPVHL